MAGLPASLVFGKPPAKQSPGARQSPVQSKAKPDADSWRAEYERVKGILAISAPADGQGGWRGDLERAQAALQGLGGAAGGARAALEGNGQRLAAKLEQATMLEEGVNQQLAGSREEVGELDRQLEALQAEHDSRREYVAELHKELAYLNGEMEERRRQLEETGDSLSSAKPVAQLRAAIADLRAELVQMDVQVGVLQHLLLRRSIQAA